MSFYHSPGALALSKTKHTGLLDFSAEFPVSPDSLLSVRRAKQFGPDRWVLLCIFVGLPIEQGPWSTHPILALWSTHGLPSWSTLYCLAMCLSHSGGDVTITSLSVYALHLITARLVIKGLTFLNCAHLFVESEGVLCG